MSRVRFSKRILGLPFTIRSVIVNRLATRNGRSEPPKSSSCAGDEFALAGAGR